VNNEANTTSMAIRAFIEHRPFAQKGERTHSLRATNRNEEDCFSQQQTRHETPTMTIRTAKNAEAEAFPHDARLQHKRLCRLNRQKRHSAWPMTKLTAPIFRLRLRSLHELWFLWKRDREPAG